jgi:hypothetical protein
MARPTGFVRRAARRVRRTYVFMCAREDALRHGLIVPSGVWSCTCSAVAFTADAFRLHLAVAH